jgi:hypothetical protein
LKSQLRKLKRNKLLQKKRNINQSRITKSRKGPNTFKLLNKPKIRQKMKRKQLKHTNKRILPRNSKKHHKSMSKKMKKQWSLILSLKTK